MEVQTAQSLNKQSFVKRETHLVQKPKKIENFKDLRVWQKAREICLQTYALSRRLPREELYGLIDQMKRSSVSIAANIAEGFNRFHEKEYRQFLFISLGSIAELETHFEISIGLKYLNPTDCASVLENINHESRMLRNLVKKLVAPLEMRFTFHKSKINF